MAIMTPAELTKEVAQIDRYVADIPKGQIPIEHQLAILSHALGLTMATLRDTMDTLAAHLTVSNVERNSG